MSSSNNNKSEKNKKINKQPKPINKITISLAGIFVLGLIGLFAYFVSSRSIKGEEYKKGYSYESSDSVEVTAPNIDDCMTQCRNDSECNGITFNKTNNKCKKSKKGLIMKSISDNYGWEKSDSERDFKSNTVIIGYTKEPIIKNKNNFTNPIGSGFNYNFWLHIDNWNDYNYGFWKNVFHKGTEPSSEMEKSNNWDDIINNIPEQTIGVWLSPYSPILRICINTNKYMQNNYQDAKNMKDALPASLDDPRKPPTETYQHPGISSSHTSYYDIGSKSDVSHKTYKKQYNQYDNYNDDDNVKGFQHSKMEWFDITDIPINKLFMINVNINKNMVEIYLNNKLRYIFYLEQGADFDIGGNLYAKHGSTFSGSIYNLTYLPTFIKHSKIKELYSLKPKENT